MPATMHSLPGLRPSATFFRAAVNSEELALGQLVVLHGGEHVFPGGAGGQAQLGVQSIEFEEITMRLPSRRRWATVTDPSEIIGPLPRPMRQVGHRQYPGRQLADVGRQVEEQ